MGKHCRIEVAPNQYVWYFKRDIIIDPKDLRVLSFDAADAIVIIGGEDIPKLDLQLLMNQDNDNFLRTVFVKNVRNSKNVADYGKLKTDLQRKLQNLLGMKQIMETHTGLQPNWLGLIGTTLECQGGHALKSLIVPPGVHDGAA